MLFQGYDSQFFSRTKKKRKIWNSVENKPQQKTKLLKKGGFPLFWQFFNIILFNSGTILNRLRTEKTEQKNVLNYDFQITFLE